ncbi:succinate dehydrogenase, cytochrome b556 subunit [Caenispirillum bisanense]|uniref:Succinate dehydrogenase cytochrome b556 subunit n=1 Tax=Caenispirillum bisanense TaxID=414052 RepID=A0A286GK77_9PROT|nr:succinate dehydrogenase, cytochrome b556 subunit [Caenispirillum bisanense]SOD95938.1 succinate dehydrogenase subunit C [Caenispirillum bisanense]
MKSDTRPISPHLQIYKLPIEGKLSITHRITGVGLSVGMLLLLYWVGAAAYGPESYDAAMGFITSWFGYLLLLGFSVAFFFHLVSGIRHLTWDIGVGLTKEEARRSSYAVIAATGVLTVLAWIIGLA